MKFLAPVYNLLSTALKTWRRYIFVHRTMLRNFALFEVLLKHRPGLQVKVVKCSKIASYAQAYVHHIPCLQSFLRLLSALVALLLLTAGLDAWIFWCPEISSSDNQSWKNQLQLFWCILVFSNKRSPLAFYLTFWSCNWVDHQRQSVVATPSNSEHVRHISKFEPVAFSHHVC